VRANPCRKLRLGGQTEEAVAAMESAAGLLAGRSMDLSMEGVLGS
jgi:hypothetical protein